MQMHSVINILIFFYKELNMTDLWLNGNLHFHIRLTCLAQWKLVNTPITEVWVLIINWNVDMIVFVKRFLRY